MNVSKIVAFFVVVCAPMAALALPADVVAAQKAYDRLEPTKKAWGVTEAELSALNLIKGAPVIVVPPHALNKSNVRAARGICKDKGGTITLCAPR